MVQWWRGFCRAVGFQTWQSNNLLIDATWMRGQLLQRTLCVIRPPRRPHEAHDCRQTVQRVGLGAIHSRIFSSIGSPMGMPEPLQRPVTRADAWGDGPKANENWRSDESCPYIKTRLRARDHAYARTRGRGPADGRLLSPTHFPRLRRASRRSGSKSCRSFGSPRRRSRSRNFRFAGSWCHPSGGKNCRSSE